MNNERTSKRFSKKTRENVRFASIIFVVIGAFIGFGFWATNHEARVEQRKKDHIVECVERTDDTEWCLEVID